MPNRIERFPRACENADCAVVFTPPPNNPGARFCCRACANLTNNRIRALSRGGNPGAVRPGTVRPSYQFVCKRCDHLRSQVGHPGPHKTICEECRAIPRVSRQGRPRPVRPAAEPRRVSRRQVARSWLAMIDAQPHEPGQTAEEFMVRTGFTPLAVSHFKRAGRLTRIPGTDRFSDESIAECLRCYRAPSPMEAP